VGILSGVLLDQVFGSPIGYQIMFVGSFVVALAEISFFLRMKEQDQAEVPIQTEAHGWRAYSAVFQHRPFVLFLFCSIPFHFTWQMVWPLFDRYNVTYMHANNTWIQMITLANSGGAFFAYPLWASVARRYGNGIVLGYSALFLATAPALTAVATTLGWLAAINLVTGLGGAGVLILVLNNLLEVSPAEGRPRFLAVHAALISITGTIGPMLGAFMMEHMDIRLSLTLSSVARLITGSSFFILHYWYRRRQGNRFNMEKTTIDNPIP
jgi:predicted MFS family arabinose efflux permease